MGFVFQLHAAGLTDIGQKRSNNEDYIGFFEPTEPQEVLASGCLYVVADGVGGAAQGERASKYAVQKLLYAYYKQADVLPADRLKNIIQEIGNDIHAYGQSAEGVRMATTLVAAVVWREKLIVANVGDSRAYLLRGNEAKQLTQDHSLVAEMLRNGLISEEEARESNYKNRLTRSLGGEANPKVDLFEYDLQEGDRIVLCSDGLSRYAAPEDLLRLASEGTPEEAVRRLIDFANQKGGEDNISAIVVAVGQRIEVEHWTTDSKAAAITPPDALAAPQTDEPTAVYAAEGAATTAETPWWFQHRWKFISLLGVVMLLFGCVIGALAARWRGKPPAIARPAPTQQPVAVQPSPVPTATPLPPSPTPLSSPTPTATASPAPSPSPTVAVSPTLQPNVFYACVAIVQPGEGLYGIVARFYGVNSSRDGFKSAYHFPKLAYTYATPDDNKPWSWAEVFYRDRIPKPDDEKGWVELEKMLVLPGMGILMPQVSREDCETQQGRWVPIANLPAWARPTATPTPTP